MELTWGLLGALICSLVSADNGVSTTTPTITVKQGQPTEFQCDYTANYQSPRVEWKFVNNDQETSIIYYDGELTMSYKDRAEVFPKGLRLKSVTKNDNGVYTCEVTSKDSSGTLLYGQAKTTLTVLVPPSIPVAQVPTSVTNGGVAVLSCIEKDGSPPATFSWFKDKVLLPSNPKDSPTFQNSSYTFNPTTGVLKFEPVTKGDSGEYYCEAKNSEGSQTSGVVRMNAEDVNVGGIVAAVIVSLLILALIAFAVWFAYSRGYCNKKTK
ncbi:junctional adhesion molecule A [Pelobates cultripes]|uniref:Junctional adhesion molecule A n=1 Tax=Pelobates cultripes TaxID=61616 RepID=A0AAD1WYB1_PELCU|nr:junctional adhesion molecule A [Pelobates cultripes]